ncbi:ribonuclease 2 [Phtheirospermum japonicum]|uniref:Ribonuclease 2 n=1 Tax=Phtheirospermum japonicum TaxID=374723 RepID=A0A830CI96_9LAMI|nr:ribonuclease 2 [Phtheirospermum japonicum]
MLYSAAHLYLSASIYSLLQHSARIYAIFSFFINAQKFTAMIFNSVVTLSLSAALLVISEDLDRSLGISTRKYMDSNLTFERVLKKETFGVVIEMQIYTDDVATFIVVVGLLTRGEWGTLRGETSKHAVVAPQMAAVEDGLWPDYNDGTWPACCSGKKFDVKELSTLQDALNQYWPSLSCGSTSNCHGGKGLFWEHEEVLSEAGYVASNSEKYPLGGIISAIQNAFHATPELECSGDALQELNLCFCKDFKPRDCRVDSNTKSGTVTSRKSCPEYISLPEYVSRKLGNSGIDVSESTLQASI